MLLGFPLADPIVGLLITVAILVVLRGAARDIYRRLMDAVDPDLVDTAEAALPRRPRRAATSRQLRLRWIGHRIRAEAGIAVDRDLSVVEAHDIATDAQHRLLHDVPACRRDRARQPARTSPRHDHHAEIAHHPAALEPVPSEQGDHTVT